MTGAAAGAAADTQRGPGLADTQRGPGLAGPPHPAAARPERVSRAWRLETFTAPDQLCDLGQLPPCLRNSVLSYSSGSSKWGSWNCRAAPCLHEPDGRRPVRLSTRWLRLCAEQSGAVTRFRSPRGLLTRHRRPESAQLRAVWSRSGTPDEKLRRGHSPWFYLLNATLLLAFGFPGFSNRPLLLLLKTYP